jgi:hypothetical protein
LKDLVQQYPGNKVLWQEWAALQGPAIKGWSGGYFKKTWSYTAWNAHLLANFIRNNLPPKILNPAAHIWWQNRIQ